MSLIWESPQSRYQIHWISSVQYNPRTKCSQERQDTDKYNNKLDQITHQKIGWQAEENQAKVLNSQNKNHKQDITKT